MKKGGETQSLPAKCGGQKVKTLHYPLKNPSSQKIRNYNPKYKTVRVGGRIPQSRENNHAFYMFKNSNKVRVCKLFFKNTLDVTNRSIRTVFDTKRDKLADSVLESDEAAKTSHH